LSDNVLILPGLGKRSPTALLESAKAADLEEILICGWTAGGDFFMSSSSDDPKEMLWTLVQAKNLITMGE
jgi:hypothetical protein